MDKTLLAGMCILALTFCSGCAQVATSSAQIVYNHHSFEKSVNDQLITLHANQALYVKSNQFKNTSISISTNDGEVLLAGQAPMAWQKEKAEAIVKEIPGVTRVYNFISTSAPSSNLKTMSDAWLTTKIKSQLIASADVDGSKVKVVTENGTVYLMGTLPKEEVDAAVDIASNTEGVQRVIKIFSYVHISKNENG